MQRIVVGIDGSPSSRVGLEWAVAEARHRGCLVEGVMAWHDPYETATWLPPVPVNSVEVEAAHRAVLDQVMRSVDPSGLPIPPEGILVSGGARSVLLDAASDAELLVVGHRGRGEVREALLGSVARYVIARSPCPVAVVREMSARNAPTPGPIVVGYDGSERSRTAVVWAADAAERREVSLRVVHAWRQPYVTMDVPLPPEYRTHAAQAAQGKLDELVASVPSAVECEGRLVEESPSRALVDAATDADLLVVGNRGHGGLSGLLLGSVSQHVVAGAHCPVVVVPADERDG